MNGSPLSPIGGGLNEAVIPAEQPAGTYREGENVRGIDPKTGRFVWAAQRAGLTSIGEKIADGAYPTCFAVASKLRSAREMVSLTTAADPLSLPSVVAEAWTTDLGERSLDVATGIDGQGHFLLESGAVAVVNRKGREIERIPSAAPVGFRAVPRVFAGEDGAVYTAATRDTALEGGAGRVYRWVRQEDKTWTQAWEALIPDRISTFVFEAGTLYVAEDGVEGEDGVTPPAALSRFAAPLISPDIAWRSTLAPRPIVDIDVAPSGAAITSSPSNALRSDPDGTGFTARTVDWTPFDSLQFDLQVYSWVDAFAVNDDQEQLLDGDPITLMRDRRTEITDLIPFGSILGQERPLRQAEDSSAAAPVWASDAFGGVGGVRFSAGSALVSGAATTLGDEGNLALIPGSTTFGDYTWAMIVQFSAAQVAAANVRRVLSQRTDLAGQPDWIINALDSRLRVIDEESGAGTTLNVSTPGAATGTRTVVVSFMAEGAGAPGRLFINGDEVAPAVTFPTNDQGGPYNIQGVEVPGPITVFGGGRPNDANLLTLPGVELEVEVGGLTPFYTSTPFAGPLDVLYDGVKRTTAGDDARRFNLTSPNGSEFGPTLRIDMGALREFDSVRIYGNDPNRSARTATVTAFTDVTRATQIYEVAGSLERATSEGSFLGEVRLITSGAITPVQFLDITFSGSHAGTSARITEIEVLRQDVRDDESSAEFVLGEFVAIRNTSDPQREQLEGYLAHRFGVAHTLDAAHPYFGPGNAPVGAGSTAQDAGLVAATLTSTDPILAKWLPDGTPVAAYTGAGVGLGAAVSGEKIVTFGEPSPSAGAADSGTLLTRFRDDGLSLTREGGVAAGTDEPAMRATGVAVGPCLSTFVGFEPKVGSTGTTSVRRYDMTALTETWSLPVLRAPRGLSVAGLQLDATLSGGDCGPEFLFTAHDQSVPGAARRVDVLGLKTTGQTAGRDQTKLAVLSNGDVWRESSTATSGWELVEAAALPGDRPGSATMFGKTFFADGVGYRVYDHQLGQLRDFEEAVSGDFPPRCRLIAAYRSRLVIAAGDNAFTVFQSRFGDPFDFDFGPEVTSISQAIAGTTASQGNVPDPITALMPFRDDFLYIGTAEGLFVQVGDLADGGRLDQVDKSQGVAFGYAWCETPSGIYYFSSRGGVMFVSPQGGLALVSGGAIQRRLEEIDLRSNRIELAYNWIDKTVHVYVIPADLGSRTEHYVYEEALRAWHIDTFGEGFERAVTVADSLIGDDPEDRTMLLGFGDGYARRWDQYALDDDGEPVRSRVVVGPLVPGSAGVEAQLSGVQGQLASDQGAVEVGARASDSADAPGPAGRFEVLSPGQGLGVPMNVSAPAVFIEVRGLGRSWAIHQLRAEVSRSGASRSTG